MLFIPLDPNCPPAVLPSYPNTPNTHSSGYSTAGHSRSSSPMGPAPATATAHSQSLLHTLESSFCAPNDPGGLLPIPNSINVNRGIPTDVCTNNPSLVLAAASNDLSMLGNFPALPGQFVVYFHINPGVSVSFQVGEQIQVVKGQYTRFWFKKKHLLGFLKPVAAAFVASLLNCFRNVMNVCVTTTLMHTKSKSKNFLLLYNRIAWILKLAQFAHVH